ncbi:MAG: PIG-L family deacetylase [Acidobacteria bacterium]|nr:MAG: PIG-L family deacetylase [Acidobacteriota bacterium]
MSIERVLRCCPTVSRANRSVRSVHRSAARLACLFWLLAAIPAARSLELEPRAMDAARLQLAIERLPVMASVLYVAAHPDDENTALLSYLAQGELAHTTYLSITRGDGGQNLLGTEQGELLGLIRTEELLAARRIDGAEQLFTRAVDFGYTKTVEESLEYWGREEVLGDVVRAIRRLQPDVVIMRFPGDGRGGHGQHTASAVLATEGFEAAADPLRFPEQLSGDTTLGPWHPKRLLWDAARFFGGPQEVGDAVAVDVGSFSALLGRSFTEIAADSRTMHKSQGFGATGSRGEQLNPFEHRAGEPGQSLFDGIDTTWARVGAPRLGERLEVIATAFEPRRPYESVPELLAVLEETRRVAARTESRGNRQVWLQRKIEEIERVVLAASGLWIEALAEEPRTSPGGDLRLTVNAVNRSPLTLRLAGVDLPFAAAAGDSVAAEIPAVLNQNRPFEWRVTLAVPRSAAISNPYWLRRSAGRGLFAVEDPALIGRPRMHALELAARIAFAEGEPTIEVRVPIQYRWTDRVEGERRRDVSVVPRLSVQLQGEVFVFSSPEPRSIAVQVEGAARGERIEVTLELPEGWSSVPARHVVDSGDAVADDADLRGGDGEFEEVGYASTQRVVFEVRPPSRPTRGTVTPVVRSAPSGERFDSRVQEVDLDHIPVQTVVLPAAGEVVRLDLQRRGELIGYVEGAGDEIPAALAEVGYEVVLLGDEDLERGDLDRFDAIVLGVRAHNTRAALQRHNDRVLDYVRRGGTVVAQYNTISFRGPREVAYGPYPLTLSRDRVSVEQAPVRLLDADHPVLRSPNRITQQDFEGWVQERGLYFPDAWGDDWAPLLASADPGEPERLGGLLYAEYGAGVFVYTGISFFRQLPAGVPGAYRLFVNLVSARSTAAGE